MSLVAFSEVWRKSQASGGTLLVLLAIADQANTEDVLAWVGEDNLAAKSRMSTRQVRRAIEELKDLNELEIWEWNPGIGPWRNCYRVILGDFACWRGIDPGSKLASAMTKAKRGTVKTRPKISQAIRRGIMERDGYRCQHCSATEQLQIDHIVPWSKGGASTTDNLQVLCAPCNLSKKDKLSVSMGTPTSGSTGHPRPVPKEKGSKEPSGNRPEIFICPKCELALKTELQLIDHRRNVHEEDIALPEEEAA